VGGALSDGNGKRRNILRILSATRPDRFQTVEDMTDTVPPVPAPVEGTVYGREHTRDEPMCPWRAEMARDATTAPWSCGCGEVLGWLWSGGSKLGLTDPGTGDVFVVVEAPGDCEVICARCKTGSYRRLR